MQALTSLAPLISNVAKIGSTGYNLYNQFQQTAYQNKLRSLAQDPAKMAAFAAGYTKPLNAGLTAGVNNEAQAYLASRGLSDSPQISQEVASQAIAPYINDNQTKGYQLALQALGLGGGAIPPATQQSTSQSQLAQILAGMAPKGSVGVDPASWGDILTNNPSTPSVDLSTIYEPDYSAGMGVS